MAETKLRFDKDGNLVKGWIGDRATELDMLLFQRWLAEHGQYWQDTTAERRWVYWCPSCGADRPLADRDLACHCGEVSYITRPIVTTAYLKEKVA